MEKKKWFNLQDKSTLGLTAFCLGLSPWFQIAISWWDSGNVPWTVIGFYAFFFCFVVPMHWIFRNNP